MCVFGPKLTTEIEIFVCKMNLCYTKFYFFSTLSVIVHLIERQKDKKLKIIKYFRLIILVYIVYSDWFFFITLEWKIPRFSKRKNMIFFSAGNKTFCSPCHNQSNDALYRYFGICLNNFFFKSPTCFRT